MKTYVINHLMGRPTVVLQQIVILGSRRCDDFLHYRLFTERGLKDGGNPKSQPLLLQL